MKEFIFSKNAGKLSTKDLFILILFSYGRSTSILQNDERTPMNLSMNYHFVIIILWKKQKVEFLTGQPNAL